MHSAPVPGALQRLAVSLALAMTLAGIPAVVSAQGQPAVQEVQIYVNDDGSLSYSQDPVYVYPGDHILFSAPGSVSWSVTLTGDTPFANRVINGTGDQPRRVPVLPTAAQGSYYYVANVNMGGVIYEEDPEIVVRGRGEEIVKPKSR